MSVCVHVHACVHIKWCFSKQKQHCVMLQPGSIVNMCVSFSVQRNTPLNSGFKLYEVGTRLDLVPVMISVPIWSANRVGTVIHGRKSSE